MMTAAVVARVVVMVVAMLLMMRMMITMMMMFGRSGRGEDGIKKSRWLDRRVVVPKNTGRAVVLLI